MKPIDDGGENGEDRPSTGFLPITLALTLFVAGLFVLGVVPGPRCGGESPGGAQSP